MTKEESDMTLATLIGRALIGIPVLALAAPVTALADDTGGYAWTGSRTTKERNARGDGIEIYRVGTSGWTHAGSVAGLVNPSFLITNRAADLVFTVHGDGEKVSSFRVVPETGALDVISTVNTGGANPVHLALSGDERMLLVANYKTGTVASVPVAEDGMLGALVSRLDLPGDPGPHRKEQPSSHPHQVLPDGSGHRFIVTDKGLDRVFVLDLAEDGTVSIVSETPTREGAGPRHGVMGAKGDTVYVINELDSTVTGYRYDGSALTPFQVLSTLPDDYTGNSRAAAIALGGAGTYLFGTNRGHDSLVRFAIDADTGRLSDPIWTPTGGERPRFMTLTPEGTEVIVANELTDTIYGFRFDPETGALGGGRLLATTGSPVSVVFETMPKP